MGPQIRVKTGFVQGLGVKEMDTLKEMVDSQDNSTESQERAQKSREWILETTN